MGRRKGLTEEQIVGVNDPDNCPALGPRERLVIRYAEAMTRTPVDVPAELFAGLSREFDHAQLVELTSAIAWENYRARFDHALGIESQGFLDGTP